VKAVLSFPSSAEGEPLAPQGMDPAFPWRVLDASAQVAALEMADAEGRWFAEGGFAWQQATVTKALSATDVVTAASALASLPQQEPTKRNLRSSDSPESLTRTPPSLRALRALIKEVEMIFFNVGGTSPDAKFVSSASGCTHALIILRLSCFSAPVTLSWGKYGLYFDHYKVQGAFEAADHVRFCGNMDPAPASGWVGSNARHKFKRKIKFSSLWAFCLGFQKTNWEAILKPTHHQAHNCSAFTTACFKECSRLDAGGKPRLPPDSSDGSTSNSAFDGPEAEQQEETKQPETKKRKPWTDPTLGKPLQVVECGGHVWTPFTWIKPGGRK
jgi:hypothetical protein